MMLRILKIVFNATIIVLAFIGFNAVGGQKYIEMAKESIHKFLVQYQEDTTKKVGDFSNLNEEFQIDNTISLAGYKAVIAEHKSSGQKMVILDVGKKSLLTPEDIENPHINEKLQSLSEKINYHGVKVKEVKVVSTGTMQTYGKTVPYAKFEAALSKAPIGEISGVVASIQTADGSEKIALSISEKKKYSQLITNEFYKGIKDNN